MREIKFRAWDKIHKDMKEVAIINWVSKFAALWNKRGNIRITIDRDFADIELMQYTGLHDKNGKEIYEGDILRFTHEREDFINTDARIAVEIPKIYYMIDNPYNHSFEVIGNIYENPELLKEGSV